MVTTEYEVVPAISAEETPDRAGTVVMKFGGTSVAGVERLRAVAKRIVAAREAGNRVVAVLSAMGRHGPTSGYGSPTRCLRTPGRERSTC